MQFITLVQLRPAGASTEIGSRVAARAAQWKHLQHQIQLVGGRVDQIWNVLGNDYDLMFVGEADDPKTLHRVDVICKRLLVAIGGIKRIGFQRWFAAR